MATKLVLGNVTFQGFEIPNKLQGLGGVQQVSIFKYVGPKKGVQVLGPKPHDKISWKGSFLFQDAAQRIALIDNYRITGEVVRLSWSAFAYNVIVKSFAVDAINEFEYEYDIELEVVEDLTNIPVKPFNQSADDAVNNSLNKADASIQNLENNENFKPVMLANESSIPEDIDTTLAYLEGEIWIYGTGSQPLDTTGSIG